MWGKRYWMGPEGHRAKAPNVLGRISEAVLDNPWQGLSPHWGPPLNSILFDHQRRKRSPTRCASALRTVRRALVAWLRWSLRSRGGGVPRSPMLPPCDVSTAMAGADNESRVELGGGFDPRKARKSSNAVYTLRTEAAAVSSSDGQARAGDEKWLSPPVCPAGNL